MIVILLLIGILVLVFTAAMRLVLWIIESFGTANETAQEEYALRLRRKSAMSELRAQFAGSDTSEAILRTAFDQLGLDVLWKRPMTISRDTRLAEIYGEGHRIEDVARGLAEECGVGRRLSESGARMPETVGELIKLIHYLQTRPESENPRSLLRPASSDSSLLFPASGSQTPNERLVRIVHSGSDELKGLDP